MRDFTSEQIREWERGNQKLDFGEMLELADFLDYQVSQIERLRIGLRDAMEWNWLDEDADENIPCFYELHELLDEEFETNGDSDGS